MRSLKCGKGLKAMTDAKPRPPKIFALCEECEEYREEECVYPAFNVAWNGNMWICDECWDSSDGVFKNAPNAITADRE